jgi:hypothetical protein
VRQATFSNRGCILTANRGETDDVGNISFMRVQAAGVWKQVVSGERRPIQICREYNLANSLLVRWRHEYEARGEAAFTPRVPVGLGELNETEALKTWQG